MKQYRLADIIDIKHGFAFDGEHITQEDNGIVLVTPGNFKIGGGFQEKKCKFFNGEISSEYILKPGSYIVTMTDLSKGIDTLGYSATVPSTDRIYLHNQRIGLLHFKNSECDPLYIYYLMQTYSYQREIANTSTGATVHHTSPSKICDYKFLAPDIKRQRKIASILSAYDDLIENNQKQIKLLEEVAQRLYKEWFVNLRFPGHEDVAIVDGVPEGWHIRHISDVCDTIGGGTPSTKVKEYYKDGNILWVTPTDITKNNSIIVLDTGTKITKEGLENSSAKMVPAETILMTSRASVGFFGICEHEVCTNQGFISCIPYMKNMQMYILYNLKNRVNEIRGNAGGSTYLEISKKVFREFKIIVPDENTLNKFQSISYTYIQQMRVIAKTIAQIQEARDRLLPKLMSGQVSFKEEI